VDDLPRNAVVGTASLRRAAQIRARRPDIAIVTIRGSVQTRLRKLADGEVDATVLAQAGLNRLQLTSDMMHVLSTDMMLPAVAQGAIGIECRIADETALDLLAPLDHQATSACVAVERRVLARLDGSCRTPIAGYCVLRDGHFHLDALVAKPDGSLVHQRKASCTPGDIDTLSRELGNELAALIGPDFFAG
jgi:hydroxymethylbilane synthase